MNDIMTTEIGYYLISELITMDDRILAQKISGPLVLLLEKVDYNAIYQL